MQRVVVFVSAVLVVLVVGAQVEEKKSKPVREPQESGASISERSLIHVGPGKLAKTPRLWVGDALYVEPFTYLVDRKATERFVGATLDIKVTLGDDADGSAILELIGKRAAAPAGEEKGSLGAFFYAARQGSVTVTLTLVDAKGKPFVDYQPVTYQVVVGTQRKVAVNLLNNVGLWSDKHSLWEDGVSREKVLTELRKMNLDDERVQELIAIGDKPNRPGPLPLEFIIAVTKVLAAEPSKNDGKEKR